MNGRRLLVLTSLLVAFCATAPGVAAAKRGGTDRPVKGSGSSASTLDLSTLTATTQGSAIISHLGRTTFTLNQTITPTSATTFLQGGTATFVAANGDQLFATLTGSGTNTGLGVGDTADLTTVFTITGGTGRFTDASGTLTGPAHVQVVSAVGTTLTSSDTFTLQGRISY
jgi:hypothetical protein